MYYNIDPILWGSHLWKFMHYLTLSYPDNPSYDEQQHIKNFFMIIGSYLPCEKCRNNYSHHLSELPLTDEILQSRDKLIFWLFDLHNIVNSETGKNRLSKNEFFNLYKFNKEDKPSQYIFNKYILYIMIVILIIIFILYKKYK